MNHLIPETSGIDCDIKDMQVDIYNALIAQNFTNVEGYGRVYRNPAEKGIMPYRFILDSEKDYEDVYLDDSKNISFFFIDNEDHSTTDGTVYLADVKVVFWFNLDILGKGFRADAEAQRIASVILKHDVFTQYTVTGIEKGIDNVFRGFNTENIKTSDMHPHHLFAINIELPYYLTKKC